MNALEAARKAGTQADLHRQLLELAQEHNVSITGGTAIPATFLRVTVHL